MFEFLFSYVHMYKDEFQASQATLLYPALRGNNETICKLVLGLANNSHLRWAAGRGNYGICRLLIAHGVSPDDEALAADRDHHRVHEMLRPSHTKGM